MSDVAALPPRPTFVDLDGTLTRTDLLWEAFFNAIKRNPLVIFACILALARGVAHLKALIAERGPLDVSAIPFRSDILEFIGRAKAAGCKIFLATAAHKELAERVAAHIGLFDGVIATTGSENVKGSRKLARIQEVSGQTPFYYVGDNRADLPIWRAASACGFVNAPANIARRFAEAGKALFVIDDRPSLIATLARAMRVKQYVKNTLLFLPLLAAHVYTDVDRVLAAVVGFVAFSLAASSVYITNDLFDLAADRAHPIKRNRPFASGALPLSWGLVLAPGLLIAAIAIAFLGDGPALAAMLLIYVVISTAYSIRLKRIVALDISVLALLYTWRVLAGAVAIDVQPSFWLIAFSFFFFFGLGVAKRYSELYALKASGAARAAGRGYQTEDLTILGAIGPVSGAAAVLVFALYINSDWVSTHYGAPALLWPTCGLLFFWITRLWIAAGRGQVDQDPIIYAFSDKMSWPVAGAMAVLFIAARMLHLTVS